MVSSAMRRDRPVQKMLAISVCVRNFSLQALVAKRIGAWGYTDRTLHTPLIRLANVRIGSDP